MADKEVPEGLDPVTPPLVGTDRIIVEKKRATLTQVFDLADATFGLVDMETRLTTAEADIVTAEGDIDDLETRATALEANDTAKALQLTQGRHGSALQATGAAHTIVDEAYVVGSHSAAQQDHTLPAGTAERGIWFVKAHGNAFGMRVLPNGADLINGVNAAFLLPGSDSANAFGDMWLVKVVNTGAVWSWRVSGAGGRMDEIQSDVDALDTRLDTAESDITALEAADTALDARVDVLEAPTSVDANSGSISWTTVQRYRNILVGLATFTVNATTGEWPVGQSRILANFSSGAGGIALAVPSGHYLNGVLNGASGTLDAAGIADDGKAMYSILVTREDTDRWSWA